MNSSNPQEPLSQASLGGSLPPTIEELQYHLEGLRTLFLYALYALIALTLTLDLCFLRKQMIFARVQLDDQRPKVGKVVADFKKGTEPKIRDFVVGLQNYTASHQDFQPVLDKYRLALGAYMGLAAPGPAQPAPVKAPPAPAK